MKYVLNFAGIFALLSGFVWGQEPGGTLETEWLQMQAESGDTNALFQLGDLYDRGEKVAENQELATSYYLRAMEKGHAKAAMRMGFRYIEGLGTAQDAAKGWKILDDAVRAEEPNALFATGCAYWLGLCGLEPDREQALDRMRRAVRVSDEFQLELFFILCGSGFWDEAERMEFQGDTETKLQMELCRVSYRISYIARGIDREKNLDALVECASRLRQMYPDDPAAGYWVWCILNSVTIFRDDPALEKQAFETLESLQNVLGPLADYMLAACYVNGDGTEKNQEKAEELLRKAVDVGFSPAKFYLAMMKIPDWEKNRVEIEFLLRDVISDKTYDNSHDRCLSEYFLAFLSFQDGKDAEMAACLERALPEAQKIFEQKKNSETPSQPEDSPAQWEYEGGGKFHFSFGSSVTSNPAPKAVPGLASEPESAPTVRGLAIFEQAGGTSSAKWTPAVIPEILADCYRDGRGVTPDPAREKELRETAEAWREP